jgi:hypothetical protein
MRRLARGQHGGVLHSDMLYLTVTCSDGGTTTYVILTRHEQHQLPGTLNPVNSRRLG